MIVVATGNYPSQWSEVFRMAHVWEEFFNVASADAQAMVEAQRCSSGLEKEKMHSVAYDSRTPQTSDSWAEYFFVCRCLGLTMLSIEAAQIVPPKMARTFATDQLAASMSHPHWFQRFWPGVVGYRLQRGQTWALILRGSDGSALTKRVLGLKQRAVSMLICASKRLNSGAVSKEHVRNVRDMAPLIQERMIGQVAMMSGFFMFNLLKTDEFCTSKCCWCVANISKWPEGLHFGGNHTAGTCRNPSLAHLGERNRDFDAGDDKVWACIEILQGRFLPSGGTLKVFELTQLDYFQLHGVCYKLKLWHSWSTCNPSYVRHHLGLDLWLASRLW